MSCNLLVSYKYPCKSKRDPRIWNTNIYLFRLLLDLSRPPKQKQKISFYLENKSEGKAEQLQY